MRWHVFDQGLGEWTGHWENFNKGLAREFARRGEAATFYGHRQATPSIVEGLDYRRLFTNYPWASLRANPVENAKASTAQFAADLDRIAPACLNPGDILVFSTVTVGDFPAIAAWVARQCRERHVKAALLLQFGDGLIAGPNIIPWAADVFRGALAATGCPAALFAASAELAAAFGQVLGRDVRLMCMPRYVLPGAAAGEPAAPLQREHPVIGYFGHASLEKGAQFLLEIIEQTSRRHPSVQWQVQVNANIYSEKVLAVFQRPVVNTTCVHGHLSSEVYFDLMNRTDIVLMPYQPAKYATTPSAVFTEALGADKVLVLPAGTWLSRQADAVGAGVTSFTTYDAASITAALWNAIDRWPELRGKAKAAGARWREANSTARFVDDIAQAVGATRAAS